MSLLKKVKKVVRGVGKAVLGATPIGRAVKAATSVGGISAAASMLPALPAALPTIGRVGVGVASRVGGAITRAAGSRTGRAIGAAATGLAIYDAAGNLLGYQQKKRRRINPMNWRALNRALRRVEKAKRAAKRINAVSIRKEKC